MKPTISVILPAYNAAPYIAQAIDSILKQTFKDFELIIVDNCSTDKTWHIIQSYVTKDNRIRAYQNDENLGVAGNRNQGINLAEGKYVAWQDADDISYPQRLEKQYHFMEANPKVGIVGGFLQFFDETGYLSIRKYAPDDTNLRKTVFRYSPVALPATMIRKRCLDELGDYAVEHAPAEDLEMALRIGSRYQLANLQEVVLDYRQTPHSVTFNSLKKMELETLAVRKKYAQDAAYSMTLFDRLYNGLHYISIFIIPPTWKIKLFNWLRNSS